MRCQRIKRSQTVDVFEGDDCRVTVNGRSGDDGRSAYAVTRGGIHREHGLIDGATHRQCRTSLDDTLHAQSAIHLVDKSCGASITVNDYDVEGFAND